MAFQLVKNATKISLVGGAVYWSAAQGIWGTCEEGAEVGRRLTRAVMSTTVDQKVKAEPSHVNVTDLIAKNWNAGITYIFDSIAHVPEACKNCSSKLQETMKDLTSGQKKA